ncbi:MAG: hypothetical protein JO021_06820 [Alphaproteobacteria bacterium]|nr:hypothetical protein [Alphaproteobacteria bacterium]
MHRRADDVETLAITIRALPSFEAVGRLLEATNPFLFWSRVIETAWAPWLGAATPRLGDRTRDR